MASFSNDDDNNNNNITSIDDNDDDGHYNNDQQEPKMSSLEWIDHFSVGVPSRSVRFRQQRLQVYALDQTQQIILHHDNNHDEGKHLTTKITLKRIFTGSCGFRLLRITYTIVSLIVFGFLIAFCLQVILFLFLNMAAETEKQVERSNYIIGALLSIPMFLYGFSGLLSVATAFLQDVWNGSPLYRQLTGLPNLIMESISVVVYLGIPLFTMAVALLARYDEWWHVTALVWVACVFFFLVAFMAIVLVTEVQAGMELLRIQHLQQQHQQASLLSLLVQGILHTERMFYSGKRRERYLVDGNGQRYKTKGFMHLYTHFTTVLPEFMFRKLSPPVRYHTPDEIRDILPFFTRSDWSLERIFCRNPDAQVAFVQQGDGALQKRHVLGSAACVILGSLLACFLTAGLLSYMNIPPVAIFLVVSMVFCLTSYK